MRRPPDAAAKGQGRGLVPGLVFFGAVKAEETPLYELNFRAANAKRTAGILMRSIEYICLSLAGRAR